MSKINPSLSIPAFYAGRSVLITGATGFLGKILVEKLLWSCSDVREIFIIMRPKKGKTIDERLRDMLAYPVFDRLREHKPSAFDKLIPVLGDTAQEGLGLPDIERRVLIERVSIVFHSAASVRFDDSLKDAVFMNTRSTRDICILAAQMKNLVVETFLLYVIIEFLDNVKSLGSRLCKCLLTKRNKERIRDRLINYYTRSLQVFMHVSTAYTQTDKPVVEEKLYPVLADWKQTIKIVETVNDDLLKTLTPKFVGNFPNTYTFTKRLAEQVVSDYSHVIPAIVFRPSIVISTLLEPMPGWIDNFNGPVGMLIGGGKGVLRVVLANPNFSSDFIPVDVAIKAMITASWKRGIKTITKDPSVHVYNCCSADMKSISVDELAKMGFRWVDIIPLEGIIWRPSIIHVTEKTMFHILVLLLHVLPSLLLDTIIKFSGRPPMLLRLHRKVFIANRALAYFLLNQWRFKNEKMMDLLVDVAPSDVDEFGFEYGSFDVNLYFKQCLITAKTYLLKEDMKNLPAAMNHYKRMIWIDRIFKSILATFVIWISVHCGLVTSIMSSYKSLNNGFVID